MKNREKTPFFRTKKAGDILIWRPANCNISKDAKISVANRFFFNLPWNKKDKSSLGGLKITQNAEVSVGDLRVFSGSTLSVDGKFSMKSGYINNNCRIFCRNEITIGEDVSIAPEVIIRDSDEHVVISASGDKKPRSAPICIGDHVWIGTGAVILKGVTIGSGSVIAAGAVVTRDVPCGCLAAGVPARVIKKDITWE
ncbi:MAG: acyltransferase [Clostridia bacterium]|nr:acyltransferase [Clostridia bacterium]MBR0303716.1 acyltransferase [Clostridia bacterium]